MTFAEIAVWVAIAVVPPVLYLYSKVSFPRAVAVGSTGGENETAVLRSAKSPNTLLAVPTAQILTLYELLKNSSTVYKSKNLFGQRDIKGTVEEEKQVKKVVAGVEKVETKKWKFFELTKFSWMSYKEVFEAAKEIGSALRHLGMKPLDKLTIFAPTNRDWMLMAHGCFTQNITITTAYDTLGEEGLSFSLNEGSISTLFTNADLLHMIHKIKSLSPSLTTVIYSGKIEDEAMTKIREATRSIKFISLMELRNSGKNHPHEPTPPKPDDISCIMYTSGSTGNPKGVLITHANVVSAVAGVERAIFDHLNNDDVYLAYLPLAHILEFLLENACIFLGVPLGYGNVRTLTDASVRNCLGDIRELRPTIMAGVPAVWESIRKGVIGKVKTLSPTVRMIFDLAFALKWKFLKYGFSTYIFDKVIFNKIKEQTGGRLRFAISGGAPIPRETHQFLTVCICPVLQGYGMTETCGLISVQEPDQAGMLGSVGAPTANMEVKLVCEKESKYNVKNKPNAQGELWVRGPSITQGYYKQPKQTSETLTEDGWLMTGDIAEFTKDGTISIIDRKKNLIKLSNGEYIALEKLESIYKSSTYVQHICIYAHPERSYCLALVVPVEKSTIELGKEKKILEEGHYELSDLAKNTKLNKYFLDDLVRIGKQAGLKPAEIVGAVVLVGEDWTPHNGLLTAAMKLKRKDIVDKYKKQIDSVYQ
ncbi:long-chain fatty acid-CoA ligase [Clydaea vesicula]|uniref:Long-chain fatty acid-CoA ligase n=1 Tax=Clydaea vesicula TaxID=447962 RepID=A0AAD5TXW0_9FUNG|nr:long-chain fatty acid-CoA ligase [Clydaea vesicula]KAJ3393503.1 long-chain fatty acid-CoA ligase [Lobulomyces angularis]